MLSFLEFLISIKTWLALCGCFYTSSVLQHFVLRCLVMKNVSYFEILMKLEVYRAVSAAVSDVSYLPEGLGLTRGLQ